MQFEINKLNVLVDQLANQWFIAGRNVTISDVAETLENAVSLKFHLSFENNFVHKGKEPLDLSGTNGRGRVTTGRLCGHFFGGTTSDNSVHLWQFIILLHMVWKN